MLLVLYMPNSHGPTPDAHFYAWVDDNIPVVILQHERGRASCDQTALDEHGAGDSVEFLQQFS